MGRFLFHLIFGSLNLLSGAGLIFVYISGFVSVTSFWVFLIALVMLAVGLFFLSKIKSSIYTGIAYEEVKMTDEEKKESLADRLELNNKMFDDYKKTSDARDHLKVLEIAAESEEKK